jgi:pimeloyl-ACP methyl ester carboxylesterase
MAERLPVVYVRGYAGPTSGIDKQVDDPFYGFNDGATHVRVDGDGVPQFYQFESPLLRLMIDEGYRLLVRGGQRAYLQSQGEGQVPWHSIWVHRFYDYAATTFGTSITKSPEGFDLEKAAVRLYDFVQLIRAKTGAPRVHLVAHSMGGLVCRCMIQKVCCEHDEAGKPRASGKDLVDKLFTLGSPHGGIAVDVGGGLVDWLMETFGPNGSDIFAPAKMYGYLTPGASRGDRPHDDAWRPNVIPADAFDIGNVFCVIGTDAADYGLVEKAIGPRSDGLVHVDNAYVKDAHRAFVHRSHSGRYGLVNSEEGYQNLRRFLFGRYQANVELCGLSLPAQREDDARVWQADVRLTVRGLPIVMHEQLAAHYCPIQLNAEARQHSDSADTPVPLATVFLLDATQFHGYENGSPPPRSRYTLNLRVFHLAEQNGVFFWQHHLEQVADWEDVLIVDIGRRDDEDVSTLRAWAAWNSKVPGAIDAHDPITQDDRAFTPVGEALRCDIALPEVARPILGDRAVLRLTVARRD